ncbi:phage tail protein [Undibacterium sp. Di26W]|uniref:phage tail protein n=1 Tax=Undibacterium sp. Di26W TaxID=3413035 RepID=UPI003BF16578
MSDSSRYLRFLPAVYSTNQPPFLAQYLKIFEKILSGIDDSELGGRKGIHELLAADVIGNLFYPRLSFLFESDETGFIPPILDPKLESARLAALDAYLDVPNPPDPMAGHVAGDPDAPASDDAITSWLDEFLIWLGSWVGLVVDQAWDIDKKRTVIAQIMALYRMRGTLQGLSMLVNLLLDLPATISGLQYDESGGTTSISGQVSVSFSAPDAGDIMVSDTPATAFVLRDSVGVGAPVVSGHLPWLFTVQIILPNANDSSFFLTQENTTQIASLYQQLGRLLATMKPAATCFTLTLIPSMQLNLNSPSYASQLGLNTLLGVQGIAT